MGTPRVRGAVVAIPRSSDSQNEGWATESFGASAARAQRQAGICRRVGGRAFRRDEAQPWSRRPARRRSFSSSRSTLNLSDFKPERNRSGPRRRDSPAARGDRRQEHSDITVCRGASIFLADYAVRNHPDAESGRGQQSEDPPDPYRQPKTSHGSWPGMDGIFGRPLGRRHLAVGTTDSTTAAGSTPAATRAAKRCIPWSATTGFRAHGSRLTIERSENIPRPFTVKIEYRLLPDTDVLESICAENEKDRIHLDR